MGNRDWAQSIAEELGYYVDFVSSVCMMIKGRELIDDAF